MQEQCQETQTPIDKFFNLLLYEKDKGKSAERFLKETILHEMWPKIDDLRFLRFIRDIPEDEYDSRVFGEFKCLAGLVIKNFKEDVHVIKPFKIPPDWPVVPMIDIHLNKRQAVGFYAVDQREINYVVDEIWENLRPEEIADEIIRKKINKEMPLNIIEAFIDPLAKGDSAYLRNRMGYDVEDTFTIIGDKLANYDIFLEVGSKDKDSGIRNIRTWLEGVNNLPTLYFLKDKAKQHLFELRRWVYDDNGKPKKEDDHFMENLYRFTLTGTRHLGTYDEDDDYEENARNSTANKYTGY